MKEWQRKIVDMLRGWCPKVKEPKTSHFSLVRTLKIKEVMRKNILLTTVVVIAAMATMLILASLYLSYPVAPPLKQNIYTKTFTDSRNLVSLDVIVYYETEEDGTWLASYYGYKEYNVTVLVKPTFINTSALSMVRILYYEVSPPYFSALTVYHHLIKYHGGSATPLDYGIDLNPYWTNNTSWIAAIGTVRPAVVNLKPFSPSLEYAPFSYHFVLRSVQTDGTREIFAADDTIIIPLVASIK
jgi:hypothetical protein